jgi:hypothetical protein
MSDDGPLDTPYLGPIVRYLCPCCGLECWGKPGLHVGCGRCCEVMEDVGDDGWRPPLDEVSDDDVLLEDIEIKGRVGPSP